MNLQLDEIIGNNKQEKEIFDVEKEILENDKPNNWNIWEDDNMEKAMEVGFMKFGIAVAKKAGFTLETMTVFSFYSTYEVLKEENKKK